MNKNNDREIQRILDLKPHEDIEQYIFCIRKYEAIDEIEKKFIFEMYPNEYFNYNSFEKYFININEKLKKTKNKSILEELLKKKLDLVLITIKKVKQHIIFFKNENNSYCNFTVFRYREFILRGLQKQLRNLINHKSMLINYKLVFTHEDFIYIDYTHRYESETIIYENVFLSTMSPHQFGIYYNRENGYQNINDLVNVLSFFKCAPILYNVDNRSYFDKIKNIYSEFDILDLLNLRKNGFLKKQIFYYMQCEGPLYKYEDNENRISKIEKINHSEILDLYCSSLKQIEPLARCVFLFRVFELGSQLDYQKLEKPAKYDVPTAINYYVEKIKNHKYIPVYFFDGGKYDRTNFNKKYSNKIGIKNLMTEFKKETKKIEKEWKAHSFLESKNIGEIVYKYGRNASVHGGDTRMNARYDYESKYLLINNVNIYLELIARYLIEILNPNLKKSVETNKKIYEMNSYELRSRNNLKKQQ